MYFPPPRFPGEFPPGMTFGQLPHLESMPVSEAGTPGPPPLLYAGDTPEGLNPPAPFRAAYHLPPHSIHSHSSGPSPPPPMGFYPHPPPHVAGPMLPHPMHPVPPRHMTTTPSPPPPHHSGPHGGNARRSLIIDRDRVFYRRRSSSSEAGTPGLPRHLPVMHSFREENWQRAQYEQHPLQPQYHYLDPRELHQHSIYPHHPMQPHLHHERPHQHPQHQQQQPPEQSPPLPAQTRDADLSDAALHDETQYDVLAAATAPVHLGRDGADRSVFGDSALPPQVSQMASLLLDTPPTAEVKRQTPLNASQEPQPHILDAMDSYFSSSPQAAEAVPENLIDAAAEPQAMAAIAETNFIESTDDALPSADDGDLLPSPEEQRNNIAQIAQALKLRRQETEEAKQRSEENRLRREAFEREEEGRRHNLAQLHWSQRSSLQHFLTGGASNLDTADRGGRGGPRRAPIAGSGAGSISILCSPDGVMQRVRVIASQLQDSKEPQPSTTITTTRRTDLLCPNVLVIRTDGESRGAWHLTREAAVGLILVIRQRQLAQDYAHRTGTAQAKSTSSLQQNCESQVNSRSPVVISVDLETAPAELSQQQQPDAQPFGGTHPRRKSEDPTAADRSTPAEDAAAAEQQVRRARNPKQRRRWADKRNAARAASSTGKGAPEL